LVAVAAIVAPALVAAPQAVRREVLDEATLGEVVPIGAMELAPLPSVLACGGGPSFATGRIFPRRLWAPLRGQDGCGLPLVRLDAGFRSVTCRGLLGGAPMFDPGMRLDFPGAHVCQREQLRDGLHVVMSPWLIKIFTIGSFKIHTSCSSVPLVSGKVI